MAEQKIDTKRLATLVRRAQTGGADVFGEVYDLLVTPVYRYVYYRVDSRADAEDLTETVFLRVWENLSKYRPQKKYPFTAWVYRIAHNAVVDYYRDRPKTHTAELSETWEAEGRDTDPTDGVNRRFAVHELRTALRELPDIYQQIVVLKFVNDLDNAEIAKVLGKSVGAVRVLQCRALSRLRELLEADPAVVSARLRSADA